MTNEIWNAYDDSPLLKVALKVIDTSAIKERYVERTLYREAVLLKRLSHPNIINLYEAFQISVYCCLATEYIGMRVCVSV